jgi:hypothetical protein
MWPLMLELDHSASRIPIWVEIELSACLQHHKRLHPGRLQLLYRQSRNLSINAFLQPEHEVGHKGGCLLEDIG